MIYTQFVRFLLPLVVTVIVQELSGQVLNGGIARVPRAAETLAGYGLAWGLVSLLVSPLSQARQLGLVLVDSHYALRKVLLFVLIVGLLLAGILASLAISPLGNWVLEELHGVSRPLAIVVQEALFWLIPIPLLRGLVLFYSGLLMRIRRTDIVSCAILTGIATSIMSVFVLLPTSFVREMPIRLPILVIYADVLAELGIIFWGYRRYVAHLLEDVGEELSLLYVIGFFWPLALIMFTQGLSRPLINLFVSRGPNGAEALAVLTVVYTLAHVPYGWLNEIRNLPPSFKDRGEEENLTYIQRFAIGCGLVSFGAMVVLFWTPLRRYILESLIGIEAGLSAHCKIPLLIFSFFPLTVMIRAYFHGVGLLEHRTKAMAPSAPSRIGAILIALIVLSAFKMHGATRGVLALLCGFVIETITVWWGVRGNNYRTA